MTALDELVADADPVVRKEAILALPLGRVFSATLLRALADSDPVVRVAAASVVLK